MHITQPLKWHGGKHYLAKRIIELIPPHTQYVEPYFGGGSVLLQKPVELIEGHSEVANDVNEQLMNFWSILRDIGMFTLLQRKLEATPFSQTEFQESCEELKAERHAPHSPCVDCARSFFVRYRQSRQGLGKDFATLSRNRTRRGMNEQVSSWLAAIEGLPEVHNRLKRVVILSDDALKVIRQQDGENTFFYLDPPYLHETRVTTNDYEFEMSPNDHEELLHALWLMKGKFILSGYPSEKYTWWERKADWNRVDIQIDNKASGASNKPKKTECLWMNF